MTIASAAGRRMRRFRAGEDKLAIRQVGSTVRTLRIESDAFAPGGPMSDAYLGRHGRSPPLHIADIPPETRELALICEDPDAPLPRPFVHWVVVGLLPEHKDIPDGRLPAGLREGKNTLRGVGYMGPAPVPGHGVHRYHFQVFALDQPLGELTRITCHQVVERMRGHVIAAGELVGTYER